MAGQTGFAHSFSTRCLKEITCVRVIFGSASAEKRFQEMFPNGLQVQGVTVLPDVGIPKFDVKR